MKLIIIAFLTCMMWVFPAYGGIANVTAMIMNGGRTESPTTTLLSITPNNNASGVMLNPFITATFSDEMEASSFNPSTFTLRKGDDIINGTILYGRKKATLIPHEALKPETTYTVTMTTGVMDRAGRRFAKAFNWQFTTHKATAPVDLHGEWEASMRMDGMCTDGTQFAHPEILMQVMASQSGGALTIGDVKGVVDGHSVLTSMTVRTLGEAESRFWPGTLDVNENATAVSGTLIWDQLIGEKMCVGIMELIYKRGDSNALSMEKKQRSSLDFDK